MIMPKCPICGSTAQPILMSTDYNEDGWTIEVVRNYLCGCGCRFIGKAYYHCEEAYEIIE